MNQEIASFVKDFGRLPQPEELATRCKSSLNSATAALLAFRKAREQRKELAPKAPKINAEFVFISIIAGGAYVLSLYFTWLWFSAKFNFFISSLLSFVMISYMVIAPEISRGQPPVTRGIVLLTFLVALIFSMGSTVAGQYNKGESNRINITMDEESETLALLNEAMRDKTIHTKTLEQLSTDRLANWKEIATERRYIDQFNARIDSLSAELKLIRDEKRDAIQSGEKIGRFEKWISSIFAIREDLISFWISTLPAVFIDIISALCFSLAIRIYKGPGVMGSGARERR